VFAVRASPGGPTAASDAPPASDNAPATPNTVKAFVRPLCFEFLRFEFRLPCDMVTASHFSPALLCNYTTTTTATLDQGGGRRRSEFILCQSLTTTRKGKEIAFYLCNLPALLWACISEHSSSKHLRGRHSTAAPQFDPCGKSSQCGGWGPSAMAAPFYLQRRIANREL
jgi:hypothetical protein